MAKHRLTIEVNGSDLFDALKGMGQDGPHLVGVRLVGAMMTGERSFMDDVGLAAYGIMITKIEPVSDGEAKQKE